MRYIYIWRRQWHPTPVLLPGESHGWRSLASFSPWGCWESDTTERLHFHFSLSCIGEWHGNPLQCSCLENSRDGGAWWAAVYGVTQSRTQLKRLSSSNRYTRTHTYARSGSQSCPTLCDPLDCGPPGFSVHGIFLARILEWISISSSREYSWPRDWTCISCVSCIAGRCFTHWAIGENVAQNKVGVQPGQDAHTNPGRGPTSFCSHILYTSVL